MLIFGFIIYILVYWGYAPVKNYSLRGVFVFACKLDQVYGTSRAPLPLLKRFLNCVNSSNFLGPSVMPRT